jgi:hypothetical protein
MIALLCFFLTLFASPFKSKSRLEAENAALRHQVFVLQRRLRGRVQLMNGDRLFLVMLYRWFPSVLNAITIIRPETLVRWHRAGFRRYWRWKYLCLPKIISERNGGAAQPRSGWLQRRRSVALPDLGAHPCSAPSACGPHCSTQHKKKEFVAGAPRRRPASRPSTRGARCQSDAPHKDFAAAIQARLVGRGCPSPSRAT